MFAFAFLDEKKQQKSVTMGNLPTVECKSDACVLFNYDANYTTLWLYMYPEYAKMTVEDIWSSFLHK